ncbi:MAG: aromatic ring-hydroxylating dioxygenase subunit alpha [Gammaproteobacteria bacterium]|nr:aromatic ring-hydroxylating dioxygenase subunit alpha [Gammaproteobacteria bacterium]
MLHGLRGKPYARGFSLPGSFYTDPEWLRIEREELFARDWCCVGRVDEIAQPGDYFTIDHVGEPVLVVHGRDGVIRALANVCRHRGTPVASGSGNTRKFLCPYHHWAYDTSGQLLNAPHLDTHEQFDRAGCSLPSLACETWRGFIFVSLQADPDDLRAGLEPLDAVIGNYHLEDMVTRYQAEEVWETNWKCLLENFMEGYHLTPLHRHTLHKVNPSRLCSHLRPGPRHFGYRVGFTERVTGERIGHADLRDDEFDQCVMFAVPPGLAVGVGSDYSSYLCLRPRGVDRVVVKLGLFFFGDRWQQDDIDAAVELFRETMQEDKRVLAQLQLGLASRFHAPGPLAGPDLEGTIWDFYQYLGQRLAGDALSRPSATREQTT